MIFSILSSSWGGPFPCSGCKVWFLTYLYCCCFPTWVCFCHKVGKEKGNNNKNSLHILLTTETSFPSSSVPLTFSLSFRYQNVCCPTGVHPCHQGSTQYVAGKLKRRKGKERRGERRGGEAGRGKGRAREGKGKIGFPYILVNLQRSPFLILWSKSNGFSWMFPGSFLLYSLKIWAVLKC